jgi:hypothetical protein
MKRNKKGAVSLAEGPGIALLLVIVGIFIVIGAIIMDEVQDASRTTTNPATITNETVTVVQGTSVQLAEGARPDFSASITLITNSSTAGVTVDAGNYSLDSVSKLIFTNTTDLGATWNVSYTYTESERNVFYNATEDTLESFTTISSFTTIIAVVLAAAIILGLIFFIRA